MFWLHSDIFAISPKFPPNYLGVHRLTNHNTARTHANRCQCHGMRGMWSAFIYSLTARAEIPYCVIIITASIDFMQSQFVPCACAIRSPTRPIRQGKGCAGRNMHMVRRGGQSLRRLVIRKVFVLFSAIYLYNLNRCS
jgi:hypothetical protein